MRDEILMWWPRKQGHHERMNAETTKAAELSLPQAFLLLATKDHDGTPEIPVFALRTTLAGAILAELELAGAIELQGKHVRATRNTPATDFQHELELIRGKSRPHTPKRWVSMLEGRAEVQRVYETMASRGIVEHLGEKHLGVFKSVRYPEKDHGPEAAVLKKIEAALSGPPSAQTKPDEAGSDDRILALIALLHAAGLLAKIFPAADRVRADELAKDYWPARAVEDELRLIRLAQEEAATL